MTRRTANRALKGGGKLTSSHGRDGPTSMGDKAQIMPIVFDTYRLRRMLPSAFGSAPVHYDQRPLQCVKCSYVPKVRSRLNDTPEGYVCRAEKACAERAKESYD